MSILSAVLLMTVAVASEDRLIEQSEMEALYDEVKTPYKYGIVLAPDADRGEMFDNPMVFRHGEMWYMMFIRFDGKGYETHLASSDNLLDWKELGCVFRRGPSGAWDSAQADGWPILLDVDWNGENRLRTFEGKYWMMYLGGSAKGYETDPLSTGVAFCDNPVGDGWQRWRCNPVLSPSDPDARSFEKKTIYKHFTVEDPTRSLGGRFVNLYNAKQQGEWVERIGMAVSDDLRQWRRVGHDAILCNDEGDKGICGDPMTRRIGDTYVMFYFGYNWDGKGGSGFDTFAASRDLLHWTKWKGPRLVESSEPWDAKHAHKPWVIKHGGIVYHFYCAVGSRGRALALATSRQLRPQPQMRVEQQFRVERFARGNVNLQPVQPIDEAAWICSDAVDVAHGDSTPFVRFRKDFNVVDGMPLKFDVSADARFVLLLDGKIVARGPHQGAVNHWYYQSYCIRGLGQGKHCLEAVVFDPGRKGALSILSSGRSGFILKAEGAYDEGLTTGKAKWLAARVKTISYGRVTDPDTMAGAATISTGTGFLESIPPADDWREASVVRKPLRTQEYGFRAEGWALFPTERPDQMSVVRQCGDIRGVQIPCDAEDRVYADADAQNGRVTDLQALLKQGRPLEIPAESRFRFLWDLGDYYCAFPLLEASGGEGAKIRWAWAESLYGTNFTGHIYLNKGNRDAFVGKRVLRSMDDTFICDGRPDARFTTPWWRSGRWVEITVETAASPLVLNRIAIEESRYPLETAMRFECDDPTLDGVQRICARGLQNCLHETFMDCPYFEQQMYPGDTRVEMLVLNAISGDDRLIRHAIGLFDCARREDGLVPMNFPSRNTQDSSTYSMCWAMMLGDYVLWHGTNAWLRARLPGLRHTLSALAGFENDQGLVEGLPGWSFVDWVPDWGTYGNAPDGRRGLSSINNLLYVAALKSISVTEAALGDSEMADYWRRKAERTGMAIVRRFWSEERGMIADTIAKDRFSEHAQCLALLLDVLPSPKAESAFKGLIESADLARTTVYFNHYLFDTFVKFGRADLLLKRLDLWRGYVKDGLKTPLEAPGWRGRSDCHAWGAHPIYHLLTGVAGIRPDSNGYSKIVVAPQPGGLKFIRATAPTPKGLVYVDFKFAGEKVSGSIVLPPGLTGRFVWCGQVRPLVSGMNELSDPDCHQPRAATPLTNQGLFHDWDPAPNWWAKRHEEKLRELKSYGSEIDLVMLGDSITHNWEGARGPDSALGGRQLAELRRKYSVVCLGYGGDTTRNVLWRVENGELDGYEAKCVMLMIGTNNGADSAEDIAAGIKAILDSIRVKQPTARILLVSIFPRGETPADPNRIRNGKVNAIIREFADGDRVVWCDFSERFLEPNGTISKEMMPDFLHPQSAGYDIWAKAVTPYLERIIGR